MGFGFGRSRGVRMLKRIRTTDVELGMYIHKLEGNWFKHPFWKSRFLLEDERLLFNLHASDVPAVVIDVSKGYDVRPLPSTPRAAPPRPVAPRLGAVRRRFTPAPHPAAPDLRSTAPLSMAREFGLARQVAGKSQRAVSRVFLEARLGKTIKASYVEPVIEDVFNSVQRNPHAFVGLMRCKRNHEYLYRHALAVSALMISLARQMKLPPDRIREAGMAGLMMDVGIGLLPVDISACGGDYRRIEPTIFARHVELGYDFLVAGGGMSPAVLDVALNHHEALDGSGYPKRLPGERIDQLSRMAAICDTYDTLVCDSADGAGMDPASALQAMKAMEGRFDGRILDSFIEALGVFPIGSVVLLRSGRLAMVVAQDSHDYTRPCVKPFFHTGTGKFVKADQVPLANCFGDDEIVRTVDPADFGIQDFAKLRERLYETAHRGVS